MKRLNILAFLALITSFVNAIEVKGQDIYRLLDPVYGGRYGKSPTAGPPYFRFGSTQQYYHVADDEYDDYSTAVSNVFSNWNNAGSVQFSSSQSSGLPLETFWSDYGKTQYPYIVNPGSAYTDDNNFIINTSGSYVEMNTFHDWGTVQDIQNDDIDVETILVHEVGHIHGLAHPLTDSYTQDATAPIMAGGDNEYFWDNTARTLRTDDVNGTSFLQYNIWVPGQCSSIPTALNNSFAGVTIHVTSSQTISSNLTIPSGVTLEISSGATLGINSSVTLSFGANAKLSVNGTLNANNVTFTNVSGIWGGIQFNSGSSGSVQYCNISNASVGIYCNNTSSPAISYNNFSNCSTYGIQLNNSSPTVSYNTISGTGSYGIYSQYSSPVLSHNNITGQTSYGLSCYTSTAYMNNANQGNNIIRQNGAGIAAGYSSTVYLSSRSNCVHGNTGYEIFATNNSTVLAENTWWYYTSPPYYTASDFLI